MQKKESGKRSNSILYLILAFLLCLPLFAGLGQLPVRLWDESRLALNSYAMYHNNNYLVTSYNGMPELWNTKPPLLIWIQVFFMHLTGVNELSLRLPSALAALATCLVFIRFSKEYIKNQWTGVLAAFILITSPGFMGEHAARTSDYDALLALWTTCSGLFFFLYCERNRAKDLYLFFFFSLLAVMTKGIAGMLFFPALLLYNLYSKQLIRLLKDKHFYIGTLCFIILAGGYYLLRESQNHGYIAAVIRNELGSRYFHALEKHDYGYLYYFKNLTGSRFSYWYLFLPFGALVGLTSRNSTTKRITMFSLIMAFTYFMVITLAKTKLEWYDVPMYPFLSVLAAILMQYTYDLLRNNVRIDHPGWRKIVPAIFLVLLFAVPYQRSVAVAIHPTEGAEYKHFYDIGYYLRDALNGKEHLQGEYLVYAGYDANVRFYVNLLHEKGIQFNFKDRNKLEQRDRIIVCQPYMKKYIATNYSYSLIKRKGSLEWYKIISKKNPF